MEAYLRTRPVLPFCSGAFARQKRPSKLHHAGHAAHSGGCGGGIFRGLVGDHAFRCEEQTCDARRILQGRTRDLSRIYKASFEEGLKFTGRHIEAYAAL